ncbi:hypothetical protein [Micromonospora coerulea]|uniref:hypothetical protein n=1 Tax=Micromonospora coerulea TaxID=47856 RepID=UPI001906FB93|nr:hypothetical protein [Micromonospora veneta]
MSAHEGDDPTPLGWPADFIDELAAWVADQLGEPHPTRHPVCRPMPTSRRRHG